MGVRIRALRTADAELSVGSGSRVESLARVLAANVFSSVHELAWAAHQSTWLEAANLRKSKIALLERPASRCDLMFSGAFVTPSLCTQASCGESSARDTCQQDQVAVAAAGVCKGRRRHCSGSYCRADGSWW